MKNMKIIMTIMVSFIAAADPLTLGQEESDDFIKVMEASRVKHEAKRASLLNSLKTEYAKKQTNVL
jgi:hypothetical protein